MSLLRRIVPLVIAAAALAGPARAQGLYWETDNTGGPGGPQTARFWALPKMMKIAGSDGHTVIVRSDQDKLISVDEKKKTYWEMSFTQLEQMSKQMHAQMESAMAQMKDKMKDMPPEQRAMVEKMMGQMQQGKEQPDKAPNVDVKATGKTKEIAGYTSEEFVATENGKPILTAWTTEEVTAFKPMRGDFIALQKRLNETNRAFRSGLAEAYTKIEGFPMETEMGGVKSVVTKVESRPLQASEFEPPPGFKQEAPPAPPQKP